MVRDSQKSSPQSDVLTSHVQAVFDAHISPLTSAERHRLVEMITETMSKIPLPHDALREQVRVVLELFNSLKKDMNDWSRRSERAPDDVVLNVTHYYQNLFRDLDRRIAEVHEAVITRDKSTILAEFAIDPAPILSAREHIAIVLAFDPAKMFEAEADFRSGRVATLEQMRRELRNPAH